MAVTEKILLQIQSDVNKALTDLVKLEKRFKQLQKSQSKLQKNFKQMQTVFFKVTAVAATLGVVYQKIIKPASDLQETTSKFKTVFKDVGNEAEIWADKLRESYGLSEIQSRKLLSNTADLLTGFGMTGKSALDLSSQVQTLAVDLASFTNIEGGAERASQALTKALFGEREALKELGIVITETELNQRLQAKGLDKLTGQALRQAKAQETLLFAQEQSKNAMGDFARTSGSFANRMRIMNARIEDVAANLGKGMLDPLAELADTIVGVGSGAATAAERIGRLIGTVIRLVNVALAGGKVVMKLNPVTALIEAGKALTAGENPIENAKKTMAEFGNAVKAMKGDLAAYTDETENNTNATTNNTITTQQNEESKKAMGAAGKEAIKKQQEALQSFNEWRKSEDELEIEEINRKREFIIENAMLTNEQLQELELLHQEKLAEIRAEAEEKETERRIRNVQTAIQSAQQIVSGVSKIMNLHSKMEHTRLDNDLKKKKAFVNAVVKDEEKRDQIIQALEFAAEIRRKQMRKREAESQKAVAIANAIIGAAGAIIMALSSLPPPASFIMAAIAGAMAAVQIGIIAATPIPAQEGALIKGSAMGTQMIAGEKGKDEMIIPFENEEVQERLGERGIMGGGQNISIHMEGAVLANENLPEDFVAAIDRGLFRLDQDSNSTFASKIREANNG